MNLARIFFVVFVSIGAMSLFSLFGGKPHGGFPAEQRAPVFDCRKGAPIAVGDKDEWGFGFDFPCYANYYRLLVKKSGGGVAMLDLKHRAKGDLYLEQRCHELAHAIGRNTLENAPSPAEAFAQGDAYCANGYYHGIMQELVLRQGHRNPSQEFLDTLCISRVPGKTMSSADHTDCSHGIGHGIMYANGNEVFDALKTCDRLSNLAEREPCWGGVFMENLLTDFSQHQTKYVNSEDLLFPCTAVEEKYKGACYTYQSSYIFKTTQSFEKTFAVCRTSPEQYQDACFRGIGGNAATLMGSHVESIKEVCVAETVNERERKSCTAGAVAAVVFVQRSLKDGLRLCAALPENLQSFCSRSANNYYNLLYSEL